MASDKAIDALIAKAEAVLNGHACPRCARRPGPVCPGCARPLGALPDEASTRAEAMREALSRHLGAVGERVSGSVVESAIEAEPDGL